MKSSTQMRRLRIRGREVHSRNASISSSRRFGELFQSTSSIFSAASTVHVTSAWCALGSWCTADITYASTPTLTMMQRRRHRGSRRHRGPSLPNEPLYGEGPARAVSRSSEPSFDGGPVSQGRYCSPPRQRRALLWRGLLWPEKVGGIKGHLDVVSKERHAMMHSRHGIRSCGFERGCTSKAFILTRT